MVDEPKRYQLRAIRNAGVLLQAASAFIELARRLNFPRIFSKS
jgi:hypothetical protein